MSRYPSRIVCLTEETTETLYLLGCGDLIVGISGFTVRPPEARQKPKVSTYTEANFERIIALQPDLVLTFSDLQADITAELMRRGVQVVGFNQRTIEEILQMMLIVGSLVGKNTEAESLVVRMQKGLNSARAEAGNLRRRPRVYFEEWYDPLICGICWVSELMEIAGGEDVFREKSGTGRQRENCLAGRSDCAESGDHYRFMVRQTIQETCCEITPRMGCS